MLGREEGRPRIQQLHERDPVLFSRAIEGPHEGSLNVLLEGTKVRLTHFFGDRIEKIERIDFGAGG